MAKQKKRTTTKRRAHDAPDRAAAVVSPIERVSAPIRNTAVGMPLFTLKGGAYDGLDSVIGEAIDSVLFFPTEIHVQGRDGFARYSIDGEVANFIPEATD